MTGGGVRPVARYVVLRRGWSVAGVTSEWDAELRIGYRTVKIVSPHGLNTVELRVETHVAGPLAAALAGLAPLPIERPVEDDTVVCHLCGATDARAYDGLAGGRWVCSGRPGCSPGVVWPAGALSAAQLDGTACVRCGGVPAVSTPAGRVPGFGQVFACAPSCPGGAS